MSDEDVGSAFALLVRIMARLRAPGGCPWDREQTWSTLRPYVLEEAYEVVDAIERDDAGALREELGDLLLQIVFQAQIAEERGVFTAADVARAIADKLVRRHPHVFAGTTVRDAAEVARNWQRQKDEERSRGGTTAPDAHVPPGLPALPRAQKLGSVLARRGFDWADANAVLDKVEEEVRELRAAVALGDAPGIAHEIGDLLLATTSLARHLDVPAEMALRDAANRLLERVQRVEAAAEALGQRAVDLSPTELDGLWRAAKRS
jgi:ATP diphosphatase